MNVAKFVAVLLLTACAGNTGDGVTTQPGTENIPQSQPSAPISVSSTNGESTSPSVGSAAASYTEGTATAIVDIDGTRYEFVNGTCTAEASTVHTFELISGEFQEEPYFSVYLLNISGPVSDGEYPTGISLVTINVDGESYLVGEGGSVTLTDRVTRGEFSGQNQSPSNPVPIAGSFSC